jgi:hypothetical protein
VLAIYSNQWLISTIQKTHDIYKYSIKTAHYQKKPHLAHGLQAIQRKFNCAYGEVLNLGHAVYYK